jgi:hypothetical protein
MSQGRGKEEGIKKKRRRRRAESRTEREERGAKKGARRRGKKKGVGKEGQRRLPESNVESAELASYNEEDSERNLRVPTSVNEGGVESERERYF